MPLPGSAIALAEKESGLMKLSRQDQQICLQSHIPVIFVVERETFGLFVKMSLWLLRSLNYEFNVQYVAIAGRALNSRACSRSGKNDKRRND